MSQNKSYVAMAVALIIGIIIGFTLRPIIAPSGAASRVSTAEAAFAPRATQYFAANFSEAQRVVAGCRDGSVRGGECANAQEAVVTADSHERSRRFLGKP